MPRYYFKEHCSALSFDGITGMMEELGDGTIKVSADEATNSALMDEWEDGITTKKKAEFTGELAASDVAGAWFTKVGDRGALVFTSSAGTISGTFECLSAELKNADAMRWNVSLKSRGTVTVS